MLRDPKKHSKFKMTIFKIIEIDNGHIKLNTGNWFKKNDFDKKFHQVRPPERKYKPRLPLFETMIDNA